MVNHQQKVTILKPDLNRYVQKLRRTKFSLARFGNGEWDCVFQFKKVTGSGSQRLDVPGMQRDMTRAVTFEDPTYLKALQSEGFLRRTGLWPGIEQLAGKSVWHPADVFHWASRDGELFPLVGLLRSLKVGVVGPGFLRSLSDVFGYEWFVEVAEQDCYTDLYEIRNAILGKPIVDVISFSAGPTAKILIRDMHTTYSGLTSLMDFGSLWDPYCGVKSRRYHEKMDDDIVRRNLSGCVRCS